MANNQEHDIENPKSCGWGGAGRDGGGQATNGPFEKHGSQKNGAGRRRQGDDLGRSTGSSKSFGPTRQDGDGNVPAKGEKHGSKKARQVEPLNGYGQYGVKSKGVPTSIWVDGGTRGEVSQSSKGRREKSTSDSKRDQGGRRSPEADRALRLNP